MDNFDPDRADWFITAAYALALLLVLAARRDSDGRARLFWLLAALLLLALGLNKTLDLQMQLTQWGRELARQGDWFHYRRQVQAIFILLLALAMGLAALLLIRLAWGLPAPVHLALLGLWLLAGFVLLRAASFHHIDQWMRIAIWGTRSRVLFELAGILIVGAGAGWSLARAPSRY